MFKETKAKKNWEMKKPTAQQKKTEKKTTITSKLITSSSWYL